MSDGFERSYDHYVGWALHLYPVLWARMQGAAELAARPDRVGCRRARPLPARRRRPRRRRRLADDPGPQPHLPLRRRRSVLDRRDRRGSVAVGRAVCATPPTASSATSPTTASRTPTTCSRMGWHDEWRALAQSYSGPGLAVLGGQGTDRHLASGRPPGVGRARRAAAGRDGRHPARRPLRRLDRVGHAATTASSASSTTAPTTPPRAASSATRRSTRASATRPRRARSSTRPAGSSRSSSRSRSSTRGAGRRTARP